MKRIALLALALCLCTGEARAQWSTPTIIDSLQERSIGYFLSEINPANGLVKDRSTSTSPASIAAQGFGLSALCIGVDRGIITRSDGAARVLTVLQTYWNGPQGTATTGTIGYKGLFYHFLDMTTAKRTWTSELSTIDTALLMAGVIDAKQYFDGPDPVEQQIRALSDSLYRRVDWTFVYNPSTHGIKMGWAPEGTGFGDWRGYNEAMILYILALGSPTHPADSTGWNYWTSGYTFGTQYGQSYVLFPPLFGHQYSHFWIDFRYMWDNYMKAKGLTYFENSRRATYAQRAYAIANPLHWTAYGDSMWGLTASDVPPPTGYNARGAPPAQNDDGTITPTAPVSSIAFAPEITIPVIRNLYHTYGSSIWGDYAFTDAFNPSKGWWDLDVLGIDQGPMVMMIENWRNSSVWGRMMKNADVQRGMRRAGFTAVTVDVAAAGPGPAPEILWAQPNPFTGEATIRFRLNAAGPVDLGVYDAAGRRVADLAHGVHEAGFSEVRWDAARVPAGIYFARLEYDGHVAQRKLVRVN
jgi:hypothetical protein